MRAPADDFLYPALRQLPVRRILVVKLRAIGDVLLSTVVLNNLRAAFPGAEIDFLTESPSRDVVADHPALTRAIVFTPKRDNFAALLWRLYRGKYDLVFDLFCNPRSAQAVFATRARLRVGYPFRGRAYAYNAHVETRSDRVHNTEFNLDALAALGIPIVERSVHIGLPPEAAEWADAFITPLRAQGRLLVALNPSGTWSTKRWGLEHFAALGDALAETRNALPIILWGPGEEADAREIRDLMKHTAVVPPANTIKQLAAMLARCDAMIANDSGPMHIGAAVGIPVLGIFGPTNPYLQGPFNARSAWVRLEGLACLACNATACEIGNLCMRDLPVETVLDAFDSMMARTSPFLPAASS